MIPEYFRGRATRSGVTHSPEIVIITEPGHSRRIEADLVDPDVFGFIIAFVDRDPESFLRQFQDLCQKLPGESDCLFLEVIAKTEVTEHLEESVVPCGIADIVEIVVFAAGANATLAARCTGIAAVFPERKSLLELNHPGIGEQQRRIIVRHQRR